MALIDTTNQKPVQQRPQAQAQTQIPQQPQQQTRPQEPMNNNPQQGWSFGNSFIRAPISKAMGSEYLIKMQNNLKEIYANADKRYNIEVMAFDNNNMGIRFSCLAVCVHQPNHPVNTVAFHVLLLEATGEEIPVITENYNGNQIEILRTTSDAMDSVLMDAISSKIAINYPQKNLHFCDGCVVPADFNPDDKTKIHGLAFNAGVACCNHLQIIAPGFTDINLFTANKDTNLIIKVSVPKTQLESATGEPIRADVLINFKTQVNPQTNNRNVSVNSTGGETSISQIAGYVDTIYAPIDQSTYSQYMANVPPQMVQMMTMPKYVPRFIITDLMSQFAYTPASVLLALSTTIALRDNNNWFQAFRPSADRGLDLTDVGALNVEANILNDQSGIGERVDIKTIDFSLTHLGQYLTKLFRPNLVISLDVPEYGPSMWYLSLFLEAYSSQKAADYIIEMADMLTNGGFSYYFQKGTPIFADCQRIHMGYCYLNDDVKRDIRFIDYVAMANIVEPKKNIQLLKDWSDTIYRTDFPEDQRLHAQRKILSGVVKDLKITGKARRLTFTAAFVDALVAGQAQAGLSTQISTPLSSTDFSQQRGVGSFVDAAMMDPSKSHTFLTRQVGSYPYQHTWNPMGQRIWQ